jgi:hypothetical protein
MRAEIRYFSTPFHAKIATDKSQETDAISRSSNQLIAETNAVAGIS